MKRTKLRSIILALCFILVTNTSVVITSAEDTSNNKARTQDIEEEIKNLEDSIGDLEDEINDNSGTIEDLEGEKEKVEKEISTEEEKLEIINNDIELKNIEINEVVSIINVYSEELESLESEISKIENEIFNLEEEIDGLESNILELIDDQELKEKILGARIRNYHKIDLGIQCISMIVKSENFFELLNNFKNVFKILRMDKQLINENKKSQEEIKDKQEEIEIVVEEFTYISHMLDSKQEEVNEKLTVLKKEQDDQEKLLEDLKNLQSERESIIAILQEKNGDLESQIGDILSYNEDVKKEIDNLLKELEKQNEILENGGLGLENQFLRPATGVITCPFGPRINPVTGVPGYHNGIDYAANMNDPIVAAKSGVIQYSGWISGYGNTIIIDHGEGVQTLYAHNESLQSNVGDVVKQGQIVALAGTTGQSTGPHLHFEIRVNGEPQDPYSYIPY